MTQPTQTLYTVYAWSPSLQQKVRQFLLNNQQYTPYATLAQAQLAAQHFAEQCNSQQYLKKTDWVAHAQAEEVGLNTFINYQNSLPQTSPTFNPGGGL